MKLNPDKQKAEEILDYIIGIAKVDDKIINKNRHRKEILKEIEFMLTTD